MKKVDIYVRFDSRSIFHGRDSQNNHLRTRVCVKKVEKKSNPWDSMVLENSQNKSLKNTHSPDFI